MSQQQKHSEFARNAEYSNSAQRAGRSRSKPKYKKEKGNRRSTPQHQKSSGTFFSARSLDDCYVGDAMHTALQAIDIERPSHIQVCLGCPLLDSTSFLYSNVFPQCSSRLLYLLIRYLGCLGHGIGCFS